eukprot:8974652-Prorocentrum_lima.AAC.1
MTSSLVGSEMCIRDSPRAGSRPARLIAAHPLHHHRRRPREPARVITNWTVSYTHLTLPTICSV